MQPPNEYLLNESIFELDLDREINLISERIRSLLSNNLHKRGLIVAISGGIDSSVSTALCVNAVGRDKVLGLLLPESDSSHDSIEKGKILANHLGIDYLEEDISNTLTSIGCYKWRDEAITQVVPEYNSEWKSKIIISGGLKGKVNHFYLVVQSPEGEVIKERLKLKQYLQIVAASNYKQRIRKTIEYFHADRLNYAVIGTPNRLEYDQGFFVKNGDGSADIKPIAHLYKSQVYTLARHMVLPEIICDSTPTTDTYSLPQGQDEFYFALPYKEMDVALYAFNHDIPTSVLSKYLSITEEQALYIYEDIEKKRKTTSYLHAKPYLIHAVEEIDF
jgi:NAD+ synthase